MAKNSRILLADDDAILQRSVARIAAGYGYEVISAQMGAEVVAMAAQLLPELIVLDIRFPDADGRDLLQQLKENPTTAGIPVLVWSGSEYESDRRIALALGAEDFVEKSEPATLLPKIARVLLRLKQEHQATDLSWSPTRSDFNTAPAPITARPLGR